MSEGVYVFKLQVEKIHKHPKPITQDQKQWTY